MLHLYLRIVVLLIPLQLLLLPQLMEFLCLSFAEVVILLGLLVLLSLMVNLCLSFVGGVNHVWGQVVVLKAQGRCWVERDFRDWLSLAPFPFRYFLLVDGEKQKRFVSGLN